MDAVDSSTVTRTPLWMRFVVGRNPSVTFLRIVVLGLATLITFKFILLPIRVTGDSMLPTYKDGQIRFVNRLAYLREPPQRGDIVAAEFRGKLLLLKRIVAVPGDRFHVFNGELFVNGEKLEEPYAYGKIPSPDKKGYGSTRETIVLGPSEYMLLGDNRSISEGYPKDRRQIVGKVL